MATQTTNFGLNKIDLTDVADITVLNENFDKIDEQLLKAGESGGTDLVETELCGVVEGDAPTLDPVVQQYVDEFSVPTTRKINGKALNEDITLSASDVSARSSSWMPTASDVGAVPTARKVNGKTLSADITLSASDVGASETGHTHDYAPTSHNHSASNITSGTLGVARGGTGKTSFTTGMALVGNGTAIAERSITNNTSAASASGTNLATCNTVAQHSAAVLNRSNGVHNANTSYTTYMARGVALVTAVPTSMNNGCVAFVYA